LRESHVTYMIRQSRVTDELDLMRARAADAGKAAVALDAPNGRQRNRDLIRGAAVTEAIESFRGFLHESGHIRVAGRPVRGGAGGRHIAMAYSVDSLAPAPGPEDYLRLVNLASYNYAGLNGHPRVNAAAMDALERCGTTTSGVRLLSGTTDLHLELERRLACYLGTEDCMTFSSGFAANVSVFAGLCAQGDVVFSDLVNHQSIVDGLRLSGATVVRYPHRDLAQLERKLASSAWSQRKFIVSDGIFSMDGDVVELERLVRLADAFNAFLIIDDAHGTGAYGPLGRGSVAAFGLHSDVDLITGSLSKALPGIGGFAAGPKDTLDYLRFGASSYMYSASLPPPIVAGLIAAVDLLESDASIQTRLKRNEALLRGRLEALGFDLMGSTTAIIAVRMPDSDTALRMAAELHEHGVYVAPLVHPVVSRKHARLRINTCANLENADLQFAVEQIQAAARKLGVL